MNLYGPQIGTQPYIFLSTIKYEVTLAMVMLKYVCILSSTKWKEINRMKTVQEIEVKLKTLLNKRE